MPGTTLYFHFLKSMVCLIEQLPKHVLPKKQFFYRCIFSQIDRNAFEKLRFLKSHLSRLKPKVIKYRGYKKFDKKKFLSDVKLPNFSTFDDPDQAYDKLVSTFQKLVANVSL